MNRLLKLITLIVLVVVTSTLFAQGAPVVEKKQISKGVTLMHSYTPGEMGSFDKLFIEANGKELEIFSSEGRKIKEVIPVDSKSDGVLDYIVSMDCGGSGGYYDIALVRSKENAWTVAWEDSFAQPKMKLNKEKNKTILVIEHFEIENDKPVKKVTTFDLTNSLVKKE